MQVLSRRQIPKNGDHDGLHLLRTGIQCRTQLCECVQKCSGQQKCITKNSEKIKWARKREKCAFADMLGFILSFIHCTSTQNAKIGYAGALCKTCWRFAQLYAHSSTHAHLPKQWVLPTDEDAGGISIITDRGTRITGSTTGGSFPSSPCFNRVSKLSQAIPLVITQLPLGYMKFLVRVRALRKKLRN